MVGRETHILFDIVTGEVFFIKISLATFFSLLIIIFISGLYWMVAVDIVIFALFFATVKQRAISKYWCLQSFYGCIIYNDNQRAYLLNIDVEDKINCPNYLYDQDAVVLRHEHDYLAMKLIGP